MKTNNSPAIYIVSLGCAKNLVDTEVMCGGLAIDGFLLTDQLDQADIILINTCSFIRDAREEAHAEISAALEWKRQEQGRMVIVGGCLPQRDIEEVRRSYSEVDMFIGLDDVPHLGKLLQERVGAGELRARDFTHPPQYIYDHRTPRLQLTPANYAYIKIAEGCNHFCRFCAIPAIRGRFRSRDIDSIKAEMRNLLDRGVREINLIAQDTTAYGADREDGNGLAELLRECTAIDGDYWIRILYTHPRYFSEELLDVMAACSPRVVPYIDMPLQHISPGILQAMGRQTPPANIRKLLKQIRTRLPEAILRTTFLVGYPGETEADYQTLRNFVEEIRFDRMGVFAFSPEPGTAAAEFTTNLVPEATARARRSELLTIQQDIALEKNRDLIGKSVRVLVEGAEDSGWFQGRTAGDAPDVDNHVHFESHLEDTIEAGFVQVHINDAGPYDLYGCVT